MRYRIGANRSANARVLAVAAMLLGSSAALAQMQGEPPAAPATAPAPDAPASDTPTPVNYVYDSQVGFSPTYSSGYYYASPYAGYTSLAYYSTVYSSRRFGG